MADVNRKIQETRDSAMMGDSTSATGTTTRGSSSEQTGMQTDRETRARGSSAMHDPESMGRARGGSDYARSLCDREHAMGERERGMSERERGMGDRERAIFDRECAMTDRERSSARGDESQGESSTGGMSSGQSRTGGQSGSSETQTNR